METEKKEKKSPIESEIFKAFQEALDGKEEVEEKIRVTLDFMKEMLGKPDGVSLKEFWEAKKLCGALFKEKMNPIKRNHLWNEYAEMGDEARRLKEIKDEQAAFSIEQVELAIEALEADIGHYDRLVAGGDPIHFPKGTDKLRINLGEYETIQKELILLKTLISRLDALRKEILTIDMRVSHKNKILKRLSTLGDHVFPKRKELIKKVSDQFVTDVEGFIKERFSGGKVPYYALRNEIKLFQGLAKILTLNTQSFNSSRKLLSECWDKIKEKEVEKKAELEGRSEEWKKNYEELLPKVEEFEAFCKNPENQDRGKVLEASNSLQEAMRGVSLSREQVKEFKERIQKGRGEVLDKLQEKIEEVKAAGRKKIEDLKANLVHLIEKESTTSLEDLEKGEGELKEVYESLSLSPTEIHTFERNFADLKSFILDKKEQVVGADDLEDLYEERAAHVEVIKRQVEDYRKEMGGSGLDFEKGMTYRELYDSAKLHLDKEVEALEHLEEKLV